MPAEPHTGRQHPAETTRVPAALAAMVFWAVGISLMDPRFGIGAFLCVVTIIWTLWLYWSDLLTIHRRTWQTWPWLGIIIITIEIAVPCWILLSKSWGTESIVAATSTPSGSGIRLNSVGHSTIDLTNGDISEDASLRIEASDHSLVSAPGIKIRKTDSGHEVIVPKSIERKFPEPTAAMTEFTETRSRAEEACNGPWCENRDRPRLPQPA